MATLWILLAVLCVATAAPADGGVKKDVSMVTSETVPVVPAVIAKAEEDDEILRQTEEVLKQEEGVLKEEEVAAGPLEEGIERVGARTYCPDGWLRHYSRCFTIINSAMDWNRAEDHCRGLGASLASIHNPGENRFVQQMMSLGSNGDVWIGAYYLQSRWRWSDGTALFYNSWTSPASSTSAPCTCFNRGGWLKASCSTNMKFICATSPGNC